VASAPWLWSNAEPGHLRLGGRSSWPPRVMLDGDLLCRKPTSATSWLRESGKHMPKYQIRSLMQRLAASPTLYDKRAQLEPGAPPSPASSRLRELVASCVLSPSSFGRLSRFCAVFRALFLAPFRGRMWGTRLKGTQYTKPANKSDPKHHCCTVAYVIKYRIHD
jgi:hypothetical protein